MGRPILVWIICLLMLISVVAEVGSVFFMYAGAVPWPQEVMAELDTVSSSELALNMIVSIYDLVSLIALFMMRRIAVPLFVMSIPIGLLQYGWTIYFRGSEMLTNGFSLLIVLVSFAIALLIVFYVWTLDRRGMLA
jgi:hypothetical protein